MRMKTVLNPAHSGYIILLESHVALVQRTRDLGFLLAHHIFTTVVSALGTYSVINMPCATVGALCDGWSHSHVMGAALSGTSLRLSSFRMCHFLVI